MEINRGGYPSEKPHREQCVCVCTGSERPRNEFPLLCGGVMGICIYVPTAVAAS